eukprot:1162014-Pelagomonas_calceolata.AAC.19
MLTPHACARHLEQRLKRRFRKQEKAVCPCENARDAAKKGFKACGIRARYDMEGAYLLLGQKSKDCSDGSEITVPTCCLGRCFKPLAHHEQPFIREQIPQCIP